MFNTFQYFFRSIILSFSSPKPKFMSCSILHIVKSSLFFFSSLVLVDQFFIFFIISYLGSNFQNTRSNSKETSGGTDTHTVIPIPKAIGSHAEPVVAGVPVGKDETGA